MTSKPDPADSAPEEILWARLGGTLESFAMAWEDAPPAPDLEPFLEGFSEPNLAEFRTIALTELIKVDLEYRDVKDVSFITIEAYAKKWPELIQNGELPADLVYEAARLGRMDSGSNKIAELGKLIDPEFTTTTSLLVQSRAHQLKPGQTIDDFDLLAKLGTGAFASVFLARQNSMQRLVALKVSADKGVEGQTLAQLDHPHIVRVYDQRVTGTPPMRLMYMQYIAGGTLNSILKNLEPECRDGKAFIESLNRILDDVGEPRPVDSANRDWIAAASWDCVVSRIGAQLSDALEYAHLNSVLHRDIKPANVLVDLNGYPKLVDFNISFSSELLGINAASFFGGSLGYMSPEQLEAASPGCERTPDSLDGTTDIYSLGVLLYELICGHRPFSEHLDDDEDSTFVQALIKARRTGLSAIERTKLNCSNDLLSSAVVKCLEPNPGDRFQKAKSLHRQLEWASQSDSRNYLAQHKHGWRRFVSDWPFVSIVLAGLTFAMFATWFIVSYNAEQAIASADLVLFEKLRATINAIVYPAVMVFCFFLVRPVCEALAAKLFQKRNQETVLATEFKSAAQLNLNLGHYLALTFAFVWSVSGILYPTFLTLFGAKVTSTTWADFILSHCLAGLITASYLFCTVTAFSLTAWHPKLVRESLDREVDLEIEGQLANVTSRNFRYQLLGVATPLAAIAMLVNLRTGLDTFAVGVLSVAALAGLVVLNWTSQLIAKSIQLLEQKKARL